MQFKLACAESTFLRLVLQKLKNYVTKKNKPTATQKIFPDHKHQQCFRLAEGWLNLENYLKGKKLTKQSVYNSRLNLELAIVEAHV